MTSPYPRFFIPDGVSLEHACRRTRSVVIGAHADDIEILGFDAVIRGLGCGGRSAEPMTGVVVTDGVGCPRGGRYRNMGSERMRVLREREQERAARLGKYSAVAFLGMSSDDVKKTRVEAATREITCILSRCRPAVVYTHNLADRHDTHVAVALRVIEAIRRLPRAQRPRRLLGCEVWRDLDWLTGHDRIEMDVSGHDTLARRLIGCFRSQIGSGKKYVAATIGRRRAHATFGEAHRTDAADAVILAMDMTPLIRGAGGDPARYAAALIDRFASDVVRRIRRHARSGQH